MTHRMARAGFEYVRVQTVPGWQQHVVYTFLGRRPDEPDVVGQRAAARAAAAEEDRSQAAVDDPDASSEEPAGADTPVEHGGPEDPGYAADEPDGDDPDADTPPRGTPPVGTS